MHRLWGVVAQFRYSFLWGGGGGETKIRIKEWCLPQVKDGKKKKKETWNAARVPKRCGNSDGVRKR